MPCWAGGARSGITRRPEARPRRLSKSQSPQVTGAPCLPFFSCSCMTPSALLKMITLPWPRQATVRAEARAACVGCVQPRDGWVERAGLAVRADGGSGWTRRGAGGLSRS